MKDLAIFSMEFILLILAFLQKPQQSICNCICFALAVINLKIIPRELLGLADLSGAHTFYIHEETKIVVVYEDKHLMLATIQIMMLCFKGFNNT